jgi:hypothetical protein
MWKLVLTAIPPQMTTGTPHSLRIVLKEERIERIIVLRVGGQVPRFVRALYLLFAMKIGHVRQLQFDLFFVIRPLMKT